MAKQKVEKKSEGKVSRNFKRSEEVEKFYRFIHDNDLRREAKMILDRICTLNKKAYNNKKVLQ
jgi:hypothetical protein